MLPSRDVMKTLRLTLIFPTLAAAFLAGCSVGPDYQRPAIVDLPTDWRWAPAQPRDDTRKGPWWEIFQDANLNRLEKVALAKSSDLQSAIARVDSARAQARLQGAAFFPSLRFDPAYTRQQIPADYPLLSKFSLPGIGGNRIEPFNSFSVPLDLSYEVDLWGRVRRSFEAARAMAQASVADYENILLTLTSDVAIDYFTLREYDSELIILTEAAKVRAQSVRINETRVKAGRASQVDVAQAQTDYTNALAEISSIQRSRAETQNALAVLCGTMPENFDVAVQSLDDAAPAVPPGLPGTLLERRPDVASAERSVAAANARIGVAYAAFFPVVSLTGQDGFLSARASDLFNWENSAWSIGPSVRLPLFQGGQNVAGLKAARATYDEAVAQYRTTVLGAVRDVEDSLADIHFLDEQRHALDLSVDSSRHATDLAHRRFQVGQTNYTEVIVAEQAQLEAERARSQIKGQLFYASVRLVKALGGDWNAQTLQIEQPGPPPFNSETKLGAR